MKAGMARLGFCAAMTALAMLAAAVPPGAAQSLKQLPLMDRAVGLKHETWTGLGIVVSAEGHLLTSHHVVRGCRIVRFGRPGEEQELASVIGVDQNNDLALLKTVRTGMPVATFRTYPPAKEGDFLRFVAPAPEPQSSAAAFPVARALAVSRMGAQRDVRLFAVSPEIIGETRGIRRGDSGGPLFDENGAVVGILTGILPHGDVQVLRNLKGLGYVLHSAIPVLFLRAYNVPIRISADVVLASGTAASGPGDGEAATAEARRVTVRIWCTPG